MRSSIDDWALNILGDNLSGCFLSQKVSEDGLLGSCWIGVFLMEFGESGTPMNPSLAMKTPRTAEGGTEACCADGSVWNQLSFNGPLAQNRSVPKVLRSVCPKPCAKANQS